MLDQVWYQSNDLDQELADSEIEQADGIKNSKVYFYKTDADETITLCRECAKKYGEALVEIDLAGDWDECGVCWTQNTPAYWEGDYDQAA